MTVDAPDVTGAVSPHWADDLPAVMTTDELALLLRVCPRTVRRAYGDGSLTVTRLGRRVLILRDDAVAWVTRQRQFGVVVAPRPGATVIAAPVKRGASGRRSELVKAVA